LRSLAYYNFYILHLLFYILHFLRPTLLHFTFIILHFTFNTMLKYIKLSTPLFLFILLSSSCGLFQPIEKPDYGDGDDEPKRPQWERPTPSEGTVEKIDTIEWNVVGEENIPEEKEPEENEPKEETLTKIDTTSAEEVAVIEEEKMLKGHYTVVLMLPFLGNQFTSFGPIPEKSKRALEFYEGVKMAMNELQGMGAPMTIYVFDTQYDENVVKSLLNSGSLFQADLIIGPVNKTNCQLVAEFARKNNKVMVSPYNYLSTITEQNPFYVQANPSTQTKFLRVLEYVREIFGTTGIATVLYPANKRAIKARVEEVQMASRIVNQSGNATLREYQFDVTMAQNSPMNVTEFLVAGQDNVVIIPSRDPGFVAYAMRELSPYRESHRITVIGMPQWEDAKFEKMDYNYYENMNLLIGSESYINKANPDVRSFASRYAGEYGTSPTENVFKGYDMMLYFGQMLGEYGVYFPSFLAKNPGEGLHTKFNFQPVYGVGSAGPEGKPVIRRFENNHINILQFSEFRFQRVN